MRARYTEYKGSRENLDTPVYKKSVNDLHTVSVKCFFKNMYCSVKKYLSATLKRTGQGNRNFNADT